MCTNEKRTSRTQKRNQLYWLPLIIYPPTLRQPTCFTSDKLCGFTRNQQLVVRSKREAKKQQKQQQIIWANNKKTWAEWIKSLCVIAMNIAKATGKIVVEMNPNVWYTKELCIFSSSSIDYWVDVVNKFSEWKKKCAHTHMPKKLREREKKNKKRNLTTTLPNDRTCMLIKCD